MKSNIEWKRWGDVDPLYAVATWNGKSRDGLSPWQDNQFYAFGKSDWDDFKRHWDHYGVSEGTCLEIGCGAGRITKHLAGAFNAVKAVDVSEGMIGYARQRILDSNVEFLLSLGTEIPVLDGSMDAVFSTHVFQHFDHPDNAFEYFREIHRILGDNGSMMIHLPIYRWPGHRRLHRTVSNLLKAIDNVRANYFRFRIKHGDWYPLMRFLPYELDWIYHSLDHMDFTDVEVRIIRVKSNNEPHPFVFARKRVSDSEGIS